MKITLIRATYIAGVLEAIDKMLDLPMPLALELIWSNKAKRTPTDIAPSAMPTQPRPQTAPPPMPGSKPSEGR